MHCINNIDLAFFHISVEIINIRGEQSHLICAVGKDSDLNAGIIIITSRTYATTHLHSLVADAGTTS